VVAAITVSVFEAVEEMFGVVDDFFPSLFKVSAGVANHGLVLLESRAEDFCDVEIP